MFHHTRLTEFQLPALSYLLYRRVSSLMNPFEGECLSLREISINVNKLLPVLLLPIYLLIRFFILHFVVACLFFNPIFYTDVVAIFLFIC